MRICTVGVGNFSGGFREINEGAGLLGTAAIRVSQRFTRGQHYEAKHLPRISCYFCYVTTQIIFEPYQQISN